MKFWITILFVTAAAQGDVIRDAASPPERAILGELDADHLIKARDAAESVLEKTPDSFVANWAMARVHHDQEGNHARALFFLRKAEVLLATRFGNDAEWDKKLLLEEYAILFEMDRNAEALVVLDRYDKRHGAAPPALRIWPLFKLGRIDESRALATRLAGSDDVNERTEGYNGMMSLLFEQHDREGAYRWSVDGARATQDQSCTILRNAAGTAFCNLKLAEAEEFAIRAGKTKEFDCWDAGYDQLAGLYILEGDLQRAASALGSLRKRPILRRFRPHFALTVRTIVVDLLYALGKVEDAQRIAADLYGLPQRTGETSSAPRVERFVRTFRYDMTLDALIVLVAEKASYRSLASGLAASADAVRLGLTRWEVRRVLVQLLADPGLLTTVTRPNLGGDIYELAAWKTGTLIDVLGTGVLAAAVAGARKADADTPEATPYLDALAGEIAYRAGDLAAADRLATTALSALPREEALLRWRTEAWQADARVRLGRLDEARTSYQDVLGHWPPALRILDLRLPVSIETDGSPVAAEAAKRLARSTRFNVGAGAPFRLGVSARGDGVEVCLRDAQGFLFECGGGGPKAGSDDWIAEALDAFHLAAFSPKVSLTQTDLNSLDGSTTRVGADEVIQKVLE
jgi:hypothetical protein